MHRLEYQEIGELMAIDDGHGLVNLPDSPKKKKPPHSHIRKFIDKEKHISKNRQKSHVWLSYMLLWSTLNVGNHNNANNQYGEHKSFCNEHVDFEIIFFSRKKYSDLAQDILLLIESPTKD